ncbi:MAG TPA: hypothetical protein VF064_00580 [Pyrinomonadaceae bacterium]
MFIRRFVITQVVVWCVAAGGAAGQERAGAAATGGAEQREVAAQSSAEEGRLVSGSRAAIIAAGLSPEFFDAHFRLEKVFAKPADRRVVWRLKVGEYETTVNDSVGSYTDEKGERHDAHSITGRLSPARDIGPTIPQKRAERLMKACIGEYQSGAVVYQPFGSPPRAALVFTAMSLPEPQKPAAKGSQTPPAPTGAAATTAPTLAPTQADTIRQGGKKPPPLRIGMVDLETGRCVVGVGQVGSPHPSAEKYTRPRR